MTAGLSARLAACASYSWRGDGSVPPFPDSHAVIVFDGVCVMCSAFARFVATRDGARRFRFVPAQSRLGTAINRHFGLDPIDYETNLLIENGSPCAKLEAVAGILRHLGPGWRLAANLMRIPPAVVRDWLYDRVAKNRYARFGRYERCIVPDASWRDRLTEDRGD